MRLPPDALVSGGHVLAMLAATGAFRKMAEQLLAERGITNVSPEAWYSLASCAEVIHELETKIGPNAVFRIGKKRC